MVSYSECLTTGIFRFKWDYVLTIFRWIWNGLVLRRRNFLNHESWYWHAIELCIGRWGGRVACFASNTTYLPPLGIRLIFRGLHLLSRNTLLVLLHAPLVLWSWNIPARLFEILTRGLPVSGRHRVTSRLFGLSIKRQSLMERGSQVLPALCVWKYKCILMVTAANKRG